MLIALRILLNILVFSTAMFFTSLAVEKCYAGKYRKAVFPLLLAVMTIFALHPALVVDILNAFLEELSFAQFAKILLGGIFSGVFISFFCVFFRIIQFLLNRLISHHES